MWCSQLRQRAPQCQQLLDTYQAAAAEQWSRASRWLTIKDRKERDGFSTKMEVLCPNFFVPKKNSWDLHQVRLLRCGILPSSLRVLLLLLVSLTGLPLLASCLFFFFDISVVLLRIRGFCDLICEFSTATACGSCLCCLLSSSQVSMHCTLSLTVCTCTPCQ